jgi:polyhydroxybutyrate depolymerase
MRDPVGRGRARTRNSWAKVLTTSASGILALTLTGCTGSPATVSAGPAAPSPTSPAQTRSAPIATPAIRPTPAPTGISAPKRQESIAVGDDGRVVDLFVPTIPSGAKAPLLVLLHASGESPYVMAQTSRAGELAARAGVIVALPPARSRRWDGMVSSGDPVSPSADATYILGLIDRLTTELPIDAGRVFVAGFSIGAVMSERIGCQFADRVTAIALDAGAPWSDECSPSRPLPILVLHGTADSTFRIGLATTVVDRWRAADGCRGEPVESQLSDIATSVLNDDCDAGVTVEFVRYEGSGHRWLANPDATDVIWDFFAAQAPG